jgi:hypothetical protein
VAFGTLSVLSLALLVAEYHGGGLRVGGALSGMKENPRHPRRGRWPSETTALRRSKT